MDISKINLFSSVANLKDADARTNIAALQTLVGYMQKHLYCLYPRFVHFDFSDAAHKSVVVRAGTYIDLPITSGGTTTYITWGVSADTSFDLSAMMTAAAAVASDRVGEENGRVFNIFLVPDGNGGAELTVSTLLDAPSDIDASYTTDNSRWIGAFSTLCVAVAAGTTAIIPVSPGTVSASDSYLVKRGYADDDAGFKAFYTLTVSAVTSGTYYDVATVPHVLAGFAAGDILPESVFCLGFIPSSYGCKKLGAMGMVYDADTDRAIDIYLQSGTGADTASVYGAVHTVSRQQQNHQDDMRQVGKLLISDDEFSSAALGSNEEANISGSADASTVGGHSDTASRRMVSFIGAEEMCGYLWQWQRDVSANGGSSWATYDGQAAFGQMFGVSCALLAGGDWGSDASCGSRCRHGNGARSYVSTYFGGRGVSAMRTA